MIKPTALALIACLILPGATGPHRAAAIARGSVCVPYRSKLEGMCNYVYSRSEDRSDPDHWAYMYERKIYEASCVDFAKDTPAIARKKIQQLWSAENGIHCSMMNFDIPRGNILKYAVSMRTFGFLDDGIVDWKLDLNLVDDFDGHTLLDYVEERLWRASGGGSELNIVTTLRQYWGLLRRHGALRCRELAAERRCAPENRDPQFLAMVAGLGVK